MLELFLFSDDLNSYNLSRFMINALKSLPKWTFTKEVNNLESISNMVLQNHIVISSLIIISAIKLQISWSFNLLSSETQIIAKFIV